MDSCAYMCSCLNSGVGQEGGRPGEKGWEAGEERAGSRRPKVAGTGRNGEISRNIS